MALRGDRVVVTGIGCIGPQGLTAPDTWQAMREGRGGIGPLTRLPGIEFRAPVAAEVHGYDPLQHFGEKALGLLDLTVQYALVAAREAHAQAGLGEAGPASLDRAAVVVGTGAGGETSHDACYRRLYGENNLRLPPLTIVKLMQSAAASQISLDLGWRGPGFVVSSACASSNHALAQAMALLRSGQADIALAGGSEACLSLGVLKAWEAMRVAADDTCRPFSKGRRGLVLAEGAAMFVLETLTHAQARGATILGELAGAGMSADARDIVMPDAGGAERAMRAALDDAGLAPEDVDYINAHGTGTTANDATETRAIRGVFGAHADRLAVSSTKSMHGHALGAAGALELVAVLGAVRDGIVPPTMNHLEADPECDLDYVPNAPRAMPVRAALSNSFAFGGLNGVLAVRRWEG